MQTPARFLLTFAAVISAATICATAHAKRYIVNRDPSTGRITLVDPEETLLTRVTRPVVQPVMGLARAVTRTVTARQTTRPGQLPGFTGNAITQADMEKPSKTVVDRTIRGTIRGANTATSAVGLGPLPGQVASTVHNQYQQIVGAPVSVASSPISSNAGQVSSASNPADQTGAGQSNASNSR